MHRLTLPLLVLLLFAVATVKLSGNKKEPIAESMRWTAADDPVHALLKAGRDANALPDGVVLRVEADLFNHRVDRHKRFEELWEFTAQHVHRVIYEPPKKTGDKGVYRRVESLPFDSKNLCNDLLAGQILEIESGQGAGESLLFAGTDYRFGTRSIEILVNGKSWFSLGESCAAAGFAKTDAIAFASLYGQLARQARARFEAMPPLVGD